MNDEIHYLILADGNNMRFKTKPMYCIFLAFEIHSHHCVTTWSNYSYEFICLLNMISLIPCMYKEHL